MRSVYFLKFMLLRIIYLFITLGCSGSLLLPIHTSDCSGFSCHRAQALGARASVLAARGSEAVVHRLSCLLHSMWDSGTRNRTHVPCNDRRLLIHCATREVPRFIYLRKILVGESKVKKLLCQFPKGYLSTVLTPRPWNHFYSVLFLLKILPQFTGLPETLYFYYHLPLSFYLSLETPLLQSNLITQHTLPLCLCPWPTLSKNDIHPVQVHKDIIISIPKLSNVPKQKWSVLNYPKGTLLWCHHTLGLTLYNTFCYPIVL